MTHLSLILVSFTTIERVLHLIKGGLSYVGSVYAIFVTFGLHIAICCRSRTIHLFRRYLDLTFNRFLKLIEEIRFTFLFNLFVAVDILFQSPNMNGRNSLLNDRVAKTLLIRVSLVVIYIFLLEILLASF